MIRSSYLRVYQPLGAFPSEEGNRWLNQPDDREGGGVALAGKWLVTSAFPAVEPGLASPEGAFLREFDGDIYVCPWRTRLRMLAGMLAFRESVPEEVADAFVPEGEALRAARELAALSDRHPDIRSHILHANWHVPLRWFAAFEGSERILVEDKQGLRIRYETRLTDARARLTKALAILEDSGIDESVSEAVRELSGWLEDFPDEGLIELDYGTVAGMFSHEALLDDVSAAEVWSCLEALVTGDVLRAGKLFATLTERWSTVRAREVVN